MYEWYCKDKPSLPLCTQHKAAQDLSVASDPTAHAQLLEKLKTTKPDKGAIQKDYLAMKTSWCAGPGTTTKSPLCMMPAQRFQTGAGNPARTALSDSQEPMAWYCSKPARGEEAVCKRAEIFKKLRTPGMSATDRTALLASLKTNPAPPYGTIQGIYVSRQPRSPPAGTRHCAASLLSTCGATAQTDWCGQTGNADKPMCVRTRTQAGQEKMTTAAAAAPAEAGTSETPPLTTQVYAADPSANLFEGRLYVYCSHDSPKLIEGLEVPHFNMEDYVVLSLDARGGGPPVVHDQVLKLADVPWAASKLWAPDAAEKNGTYFLYFPAQAPPPITEPPVPDPRSRLRRVRPVRPALAGPSGHLPARRGDSCAARGAVRRAAAADGGELLDRPRGLLRRRARRWALPLLRRHLGRAAAAVGGRHLRRVGRARRLGWEEASPRGGACHALLLPTVERRCSGPARPRAAA